MFFLLKIKIDQSNKKNDYSINNAVNECIELRLKLSSIIYYLKIFKQLKEY
jgi:hypothetical protein